MKKLLGLLGTITIAGNGISGIVGNAPASEIKSKINYSQTNNLENLNRVQRNICNNSYIEKFTNIESDIRNIAVDSKGNIYFSKSDSNDVNYNIYVLKQGETTETKIMGIPNTKINSIVVDNNDNIYIATGLLYNFDGNVYILKEDETTATKINGINEKRVTSIIINNNDIYFGTSSGHIYVLKNGTTVPEQINFKQIFTNSDDVNTLAINKKGDIYFGIYQNGGNNNGIYVLKQGANEVQKFTQIDRRDINAIVVDNNDNMYFGTDYFTYLLKSNTEFTKIYRIQGNRNILIDNKNNVYFINYNNIYLLSKNKIKSLTPTVRKIDTLEGIDI
jgi:hypothetical protein